MSRDRRHSVFSFSEVFGSLDEGVDDGIESAAELLENSGFGDAGSVEQFTEEFTHQWEAAAGSEGASASDESRRPGLLARGGAAFTSAARRATGARGNNRRFSEEQARRREAFAAFCKGRTIELLKSFNVDDAEARVDSIDLPRFVLVLTGPLANLSLRKALWLASFLLYSSRTVSGTITKEIVTSVLGHLGKVVGGEPVAYTDEEIYEIMDLAGIQYIATKRRPERLVIEHSHLPGEGYVVPVVDAGFSFNYILTGTARTAITSCKRVCNRILSNEVPNVQELGIPLIKGASGCGKTRLGREIAVGISEMATAQNQKAVHILRRMDIYPALHSQNFVSGETGKVNGEAMLLANLVCLSKAVPDAIVATRTPAIAFGLNSFLVHAKTKWGIDMIVFQIDEYRRDLDGTTAMLQACAKKLITDEGPGIAKVYPIVTGMTSYVEVYDDAIGRSSAISAYPGIVPYFVRTLQGPARAHMEMSLLSVIAKSARGDQLEPDTGAANMNVWWSQLMHDTGGHARYYKFVADAVADLDLASEVVSGSVTREECAAISGSVLGLLGSISDPANWRSLVARQLSLHDNSDAECNIGAVADSAMRRFIALAITKCTISDHRAWSLMKVDGHTVCISLDVATHSGLIGYHPDANEDAVVDISRLMIAALNGHSDALRPVALSYGDEASSDSAAVVESFRMRLCASTAAFPDEDWVVVDEARPVCVGAHLGLTPSPEWWDIPGNTKRVGMYASARVEWPTDGSLPPSVCFRDPTYQGWCGVSYFHAYAEPAVTVVVLHLVTQHPVAQRGASVAQRGASVGGQLDWARGALKRLVSWQRLPIDRQFEVVVDIVFRVPTGTIELPAELSTAKSAPIPITQGVGATAATATHDDYEIKERHKAAIASSLEDLQAYLEDANCLGSFQDAIEDAGHVSVKAITAAIASDFFPVRDIFEQRR